RAPDPVQGQGAASGERSRGTPELSRSPSRRRAPVRSNPRAGGRGPAAAPRADARDRPSLEQPIRGRLRLSGAPGAAVHRQASAGGQYDSGAHTQPRAGRDAARGPAPGAGPTAQWCGQGARPRAPHDDPGTAPHGLSRGGGRLMQHFLSGVVQMFRLELFLQLCLATVFGGAIGLERELGGKPAGLRTHILICLGSVIYNKLSVAMATGTADPTRIAAQIVTGVGFIGAGTILHARGAVVGLTSAATIWVVAAIGVALGAAFYWEAAGTTLL